MKMQVVWNKLVPLKRHLNTGLQREIFTKATHSQTSQHFIAREWKMVKSNRNVTRNGRQFTSKLKYLLRLLHVCLFYSVLIYKASKSISNNCFWYFPTLHFFFCKKKKKYTCFYFKSKSAVLFFTFIYQFLCYV